MQYAVSTVAVKALYGNCNQERSNNEDERYEDKTYFKHTFNAHLGFVRLKPHAGAIVL